MKPASFILIIVLIVCASIVLVIISAQNCAVPEDFQKLIDDSRQKGGEICQGKRMTFVTTTMQNNQPVTICMTQSPTKTYAFPIE